MGGGRLWLRLQLLYLSLLVVGGTEALSQRAPLFWWLRPPGSVCGPSLQQLAVVRAASVSLSGCGARVLGILTKWFYPTRLETRTKESNICASIRVANPAAQ